MEQKLTRVTKLLYGSGDLGFSLTTTLIGAYLAIFLTDVVGVPPVWLQRRSSSAEAGIT